MLYKLLKGNFEFENLSISGSTKFGSLANGTGDQSLGIDLDGNLKIVANGGSQTLQQVFNVESDTAILTANNNIQLSHLKELSIISDPSGATTGQRFRVLLSHHDSEIWIGPDISYNNAHWSGQLKTFNPDDIGTTSWMLRTVDSIGNWSGLYGDMHELSYAEDGLNNIFSIINGAIIFQNLTNSNFQNRLVGQNGTSKQIDYVNITNGLQLASGNLSCTITQYTNTMARSAISLTTTGTSGLATYIPSTGVLNIPNYTNVATVTSVNASIASSALSISGGPITGSGTLAFAWTGTSNQQVLGNGSLVNKITNNNQLTNGANYITVAQARTSISLTTTGSSGVSTYDSTTGVLNVPVYVYNLPIASASILGGIKIGSGLAIDGAGVVSVTGGGSDGNNFPSGVTFSGGTLAIQRTGLSDISISL
jgi:hypothetical protein